MQPTMAAGPTRRSKNGPTLPAIFTHITPFTFGADVKDADFEVVDDVTFEGENCC